MLIPRPLPSAPAQWQDYYTQRANRAGDARLRRYYGQPLPDPQTPISQVPLVALDMETTGLDAKRSAIVSIGLIPFDLDRIPLSRRRFWVLKPHKPLSDESVTIHRITHSDIVRAPDLEEVLEELLALMAGRIAVVHYREIERPFLDAAVHKRLGEALRFPLIDTMELEARRHRFSRWARFRRWLGRPPLSIRLNDSRQRYGLPPYPGHHALTDALATAELFQAQMATHFSPDTVLADLWR